MWNPFRKYNIDDLVTLKDKVKVDRAAHKIAVIDDNAFPLLDELRRHNFDITGFSDVDNIIQLQNYDIIISDIKGVGKKFGSKFEGAHLIEEVHLHYPTKFLIAYSGSTFNPSYNDYFRLCDATKRKNIDIQEWVKTLDLAIFSLNDPIFQWEKTRNVLIKQKVPNKYIAKIEKGYTKTLVKRNRKYLQNEIKVSKAIGESTLSKIVIDSISTFAATFITNIIK